MEELRAARATGPHNAIDSPQGEKRKYSEPEPQTAEFRTELIATEKVLEMRLGFDGWIGAQAYGLWRAFAGLF